VSNKRDGRSWVQAAAWKLDAKGGGKALLQAPISRAEIARLLRELEARIPQET
jgi:hypothetical protein